MHDPRQNQTWVETLGDFLQNEMEIEAILIDSTSKKASIATIGKVDTSLLTMHLQQTLISIEKSILNQPLGLDSTILKNYGLEYSTKEGKTLIKKPSCFTAPQFWRWRDVSWPSSQHLADHHHDEDWRLLAIYSIICSITLSFGFYLEDNSILSKLSFALAIISGGWQTAREVMHDLPKGKLDIHFLMLAVALGSCSIGAWKEGALLLFLFSFSGTLEHFALSRTRKAIDTLFKSAPKTALLKEDHLERTVSVETLLPGQIIICKPGDLFPIDGEVIFGSTAADESTLTGESTAIDKRIGAHVYSGTLNMWGIVHICVTKPVNESSLQRIIYLIQEAQHLKAPSQRFTDKFGTPYTYGVLGLTLILFFVWWIGLDLPAFYNTHTQLSAFYRAMTFLVVSSPCALVLSIPSAILAAIAWGARNGILFRGGAAIEKLCQVNLVALDKTGTLTTGDLSVHSVESFPQGREVEVAELAFSLENNSKHPIAYAIIAYGKAQGLTLKPIQQFESLTGKGLKGHVNEATCVVGRRELLELGPLAQWIKNIPQPTETFTEIWIVYGDLIGRILLKDSIRKQSKPVLNKLKELNIRTLMLTGDRRHTAEAVARELGIQEVYSGLSPQEKVETIQKLTKENYKVAMVGEGVNDAPSLAAAYVSVTMGSRGSDAALELSEVILMHDRIDSFLNAYALSVRARKIIYQNLVIALSTITVMILTTIGVEIPLSIGVMAHEGSTVLVCLNSLRLLLNSKVL